MKTIAQIREAREDAAMMRKLRERRPLEGTYVMAADRTTLRDELAMAALTGILVDTEVFWAGAAPLAYEYADAMLEARKK